MRLSHNKLSRYLKIAVKALFSLLTERVSHFFPYILLFYSDFRDKISYFFIDHPISWTKKRIIKIKTIKQSRLICFSIFSFYIWRYTWYFVHFYPSFPSPLWEAWSYIRRHHYRENSRSLFVLMLWVFISFSNWQFFSTISDQTSC
jgi:hypothetical protein